VHALAVRGGDARLASSMGIADFRKLLPSCDRRSGMTAFGDLGGVNECRSTYVRNRTLSPARQYRL
jgi:hypothetical protein